jgi:hypothetical protein
MRIELPIIVLLPTSSAPPSSTCPFASSYSPSTLSSSHDKHAGARCAELENNNDYDDNSDDGSDDDNR